MVRLIYGLCCVCVPGRGGGESRANRAFPLQDVSFIRSFIHLFASDN